MLERAKNGILDISVISYITVSFLAWRKLTDNDLNLDHFEMAAFTSVFAYHLVSYLKFLVIQRNHHHREN